MLTLFLAGFGGCGGEEGSDFLYHLATKQALKETFQLVTNNFDDTGKNGFEYTRTIYFLLVFYQNLLTTQPVGVQSPDRPTCLLFMLSLEQVFNTHQKMYFKIMTFFSDFDLL